MVMDARRRILLNTPHIETASGGVANFKTDMIAPLKGCKINFLPKQSGSGDPSPTNIRSISGWDGVEVTRCGKNLFDKNNITTGYFYQYTGEIKENVNYAITQIRVSPGDIIVYSGLTGAKGSPCGIWYLDDKKEFISCPNTQQIDRPFTIPNGVSYLGFTVCISTNPNYRDIDTAQVEIVPLTTSQPTPYEPYTASTFPISWTQQGTVYGGYVDLVSGELVGEWTICDLSELTWTQASGGSRLRSFDLDNVIKRPPSAANLPDIMMEKYTPVIYNSNLDNYQNSIAVSSSNGFITKYFDGETYPTGKMAYKLATPIHYQLTPQQIKTLKGINNIYSDADSAEVKFWTH